MMGKQHMTFGLTTGATAALALTELGIIDNIFGNASLSFIAMAVFGSLLPDIDKRTSTIGSLLRPISWLLTIFIKHRTYTHDLLLMMILMPISLAYLGFDNIALYGLWLGIFGHLLLDSFTVYGIPFGYLFNKEKNIHLLPFKLRCFSESSEAKILTVGLSAVIFISTTYVLNKVTGFTL